MPYVPYHWVVIRLTAVGSSLEVKINDSVGRRRSIEESWIRGSDLGARAKRLIGSMLEGLSRGLPFRTVPHTMGRVPVAVFVASPAGVEPGWAEQAVRRLVGERRDDFQ